MVSGTELAPRSSKIQSYVDFTDSSFLSQVLLLCSLRSIAQGSFNYSLC
jgi:hypothetical protein